MLPDARTVGAPEGLLDRLSGFAACSVFTTGGPRISAIDYPIRNRERQVQAPPLTLRTGKGVLYKRPAAVARDIETALSLDQNPLLERLAITDHNAAGYLCSECIVFLIRRARAKGDIASTERFAELLLRRCKPRIERKLPPSLFRDSAARAEAIDAVVGQMFGTITHQTQNTADYFEVAFGDALNKLIIKTFNRAERQYKHEQRTDDAAEIGTGTESPTGRRRPPAPSDQRAWADLQERWIDAERALSSLPDHYAEAFLLRHYHQWQIDSDDPMEPTISRYFGKTPKTIYNWLTRAEEELTRWRSHDA